MVTNASQNSRRLAGPLAKSSGIRWVRLGWLSSRSAHYALGKALQLGYRGADEFLSFIPAPTRGSRVRYKHDLRVGVLVMLRILTGSGFIGYAPRAFRIAIAGGYHADL